MFRDLFAIFPEVKFFALLVLAMLAGWITHVIVCIQNKEFLFLLAGAICAPVGVIHGWGIWLGAW